MAFASISEILKNANILKEKVLGEESGNSIDFGNDSELGDVVRNYVKDAFFKEGTGVGVEEYDERVKLELNETKLASESHSNNFNQQIFSFDEDNDSNDSLVSATSSNELRISDKNIKTTSVPFGKLQCADCGKIVDAKFLHNHMQYVHRNVVHRKGRKGTLLPAAKKEKPPDRYEGPYFFEKDIGIQCSLSHDGRATSPNKKRKLDLKYSVGWKEIDTSAAMESVLRKGVRDSSFQTMYESLASECSPEEPVLFVCFRCFLDFPTKDLLEEHVLKTHSHDDNLVKCHKCKEWVPFRSYKSHPNCWSPKNSVLTKEGKYNILTIGKPNDALDDIHPVINDDVETISSDKHSTVTLSFSDNGIQTSDYLSLNDDGHIVQLDATSTTSLDTSHVDTNNMRIYQLEAGDMESLGDLENSQDEIITDSEGQIVIIKNGQAFNDSHQIAPDAANDDSGEMFFDERRIVGDQVLDVEVVGVGLESAAGCELDSEIACNQPLNLHGGQNTSFLDLHSGESHAVLNLHDGENTQDLVLCNGDDTSVLNPHGDDGNTVLDPTEEDDTSVLGLRGGGTAVLGLRDRGTSALGLRGDKGASGLGLRGGVAASLTGTATKLSLRTEHGMEGEDCEETTATIVLGKANQGSVQLPVTAEAMQLGQEYVDLATGTKYMVVIEENTDPNSGRIILQP